MSLRLTKERHRVSLTREARMKLFMVIEHFRSGMAPALYRRCRDQGRMAPEDLHCLASWVDLGFQTCFQVMQTEDPSLMERWTANWDDLVEFEIIPVQTSPEAAAAMALED